MRSIYTVFSCDDLVNKPTNDTNDSCAPQIGLNPLVKNVTDAQHQFVSICASPAVFRWHVLNCLNLLSTKYAYSSNR